MQIGLFEVTDGMPGAAPTCRFTTSVAWPHALATVIETEELVAAE